MDADEYHEIIYNSNFNEEKDFKEENLKFIRNISEDLLDFGIIYKNILHYEEAKKNI